MVELRWKDETYWSRLDDAEARKTPRTWELQVGKSRLIVTRDIYCASDEWALKLHPEGLSFGVTRGTHEEAKALAIARLRRHLTEMLENLPVKSAVDARVVELESALARIMANLETKRLNDGDRLALAQARDALGGRK